MVRWLFFAPEGAKPADGRPGALMDAARKASGRGPPTSRSTAADVFRMFAPYLIELVELGSGSEPPAPEPEPPPQHRRQRWLILAGAAVLPRWSR